MHLESPLAPNVTHQMGGLENYSNFNNLWKRDSVSPRLDPPKSSAMLHCTTAIMTPKRPAPAKNLNEISGALEPVRRQT